MAASGKFIFASGKFIRENGKLVWDGNWTGFYPPPPDLKLTVYGLPYVDDFPDPNWNWNLNRVYNLSKSQEANVGDKDAYFIEYLAGFDPKEHYRAVVQFRGLNDSPHVSIAVSWYYGINDPAAKKGAHHYDTTHNHIGKDNVAGTYQPLIFDPEYPEQPYEVTGSSAVLEWI